MPPTHGLARSDHSKSDDRLHLVMILVESTSCAGEIAEFDKPSMLLDHMFVGGRSGNEMRKKLTKARVIRELKRVYRNSFCEPGLNCIDTSSRAQMTSIKIKRRKLVQRRISLQEGE